MREINGYAASGSLGFPGGLLPDVKGRQLVAGFFYMTMPRDHVRPRDPI